MKRGIWLLLALIMLLPGVVFAAELSVFSELNGYTIHEDDMTGDVTVSPSEARLLTDSQNGGISFSYVSGRQLTMSLIHNDLKGFAGYMQVRTEYCLYDVTFNVNGMKALGMDLNINGAMMFVNASCADMLADISSSENAKIRLRSTNTSGTYTDFLISDSIKNEIGIFIQAFNQDIRPRFESSDPALMILSNMMSPVITSKKMEKFVPEITDKTVAQAELSSYTPEVDFYQIQLMDVYGTTALYVDVENIGKTAIDAVNMYVVAYDAYGKELKYMGQNRVSNDMQGAVISAGKHSAVQQGINIGFLGNVQSVKVVIYKYHKVNGETVIVPADQWKWVSVKKNYDDSESIKQIQLALNDRGYACGTPNGKTGKKLVSAITKFQKDQGRTATGKISWQLIYDLGLAN